jgi:hypothetical protein
VDGHQTHPLKLGNGSSKENGSSAPAAMQQAVQNGGNAVGSSTHSVDPGRTPYNPPCTVRTVEHV